MASQVHPDRPLLAGLSADQSVWTIRYHRTAHDNEYLILRDGQWVASTATAANAETVKQALAAETEGRTVPDSDSSKILAENQQHAAWEQGFRAGYRSGYADASREPIQREINPYTRRTLTQS